MFAQFPTSMELGGWMICAAALLSFLNGGGKFLDRVRGKPPAEQLELSGELLGKRLDTVEKKVDYVVRDQDDRRRAIYGELGKLSDRFNASIQDVSNHVAGLQTASDLTNQRLVQLDGKLDRLIERKH